MNRKIVIGDRVVFIGKNSKNYNQHGLVIDRTERGYVIGFTTIRVKFDDGKIIRDAVSQFVLERKSK